MTGEPLFWEDVAAFDMGPVVADLWRDEKHLLPQPAPHELEELHLNTIGYVLSRYGALTGTDLEHLTHSERPYQEADADRRPGTKVRIKVETITAYFRHEDPDDSDALLAVDGDTINRWLRDAGGRRQESVREDSRQALHARLSAS